MGLANGVVGSASSVIQSSRRSPSSSAVNAAGEHPFCTVSRCRSEPSGAKKLTVYAGTGVGS